jgi:RNA polymerase sigma-70 factor, ECF subfamily
VTDDRPFHGRQAPRGGDGASQGGDSLAADQRRDAFARLFAKYDRWLFSYLVTLLSNPAHAEEVFQEVCVVVWRLYDQFELGTDFVKWVSVIAHNQVRKFRRNAKRTGFQLSDETCERLAVDAVRRADLFDFRRDALRSCLGKLPGSDRQLVQRCYGDHESHESFKAIAAEIGRPVNTVYKALNRIRRSLHECIDRTLAAEGLL